MSEEQPTNTRRRFILGSLAAGAAAVLGLRGSSGPNTSQNEVNAGEPALADNPSGPSADVAPTEVAAQTREIATDKATELMENAPNWATLNNFKAEGYDVKEIAFDRPAEGLNAADYFVVTSKGQGEGLSDEVQGSFFYLAGQSKEKQEVTEDGEGVYTTDQIGKRANVSVRAYLAEKGNRSALVITYDPAAFVHNIQDGNLNTKDSFIANSSIVNVSGGDWPLGMGTFNASKSHSADGKSDFDAVPYDYIIPLNGASLGDLLPDNSDSTNSLLGVSTGLAGISQIDIEFEQGDRSVTFSLTHPSEVEPKA